MIITDISQIGKSEQYKIFTDGEFNCILTLETIYKKSIKTGLETDEETLAEIKEQSDKIIGFNSALKLLAASSKTEVEMYNYLKRKGFSEKVCEHITAKLKEYKYIDDLKYAKNYIQSLKASKGKYLIRQMMQRKGIDKEIINELLETLNQEEEIEFLCSKYMRLLDKNFQNRQKLYRYLLSKGFSYDECKSATEKYFKGE